MTKQLHVICDITVGTTRSNKSPCFLHENMKINHIFFMKINETNKKHIVKHIIFLMIFHLFEWDLIFSSALRAVKLYPPVGVG